jgi:hypothetical protein
MMNRLCAPARMSASILAMACFPFVQLSAQAKGITGNWTVENSNGDGAIRRYVGT